MNFTQIRNFKEMKTYTNNNLQDIFFETEGKENLFTSLTFQVLILWVYFLNKVEIIYFAEFNLEYKNESILALKPAVS